MALKRDGPLKAAATDSEDRVPHQRLAAPRHIWCGNCMRSAPAGVPLPSVQADQRHLLPPCTPCTVLSLSCHRLGSARLSRYGSADTESALECFREGHPPGQHSHLRQCLLAAVGKAFPVMLQGLHARWQTALARMLPAVAYGLIISCILGSSAASVPGHACLLAGHLGP